MFGRTPMAFAILLLALASLAFAAPVQKCTLGQNNCQCGYGPRCGATNYCDTSSQNCFSACQQGVTTGSCMCRANPSAPYMMWWGKCGTSAAAAPAAPACGGNGQSCCNGVTCNSGLGCVSGTCKPKCTTGQNNCQCGYGAVCGAGTYCDASSQNCFPACQQGITTGNCICRANPSSPYMMWWGTCGAPTCGGNNQSCCTSGPTVCNSGLGCVSGKCTPKCTTGQNNCQCGYGAVCGAGTYCDASSQNCFPACQQGITTGNCICRANPSSPYMMWWGKCGNAPSCGASGQACCSGNACNSGLTCQSGTCKVPCGATGQTCCAGNTCNSNLTCQSGTCQTPPCGALNQSCCAGNSCNSGYTCQTGVCKVPPPPCGGIGQACCAGNSCNASGSACNVTSQICQSCGASAGQLCCSGNTCNSGLACNTSGAQPVCYTPCGGTNQSCCAGNTCTASAHYCEAGTQTCKPLPSQIAVYTESTPGGAGRTYPITTSGTYGALIYIEAAPAAGYDFANWSGNCPMGNIYERATSGTVTPTQTYFCRFIANFVAGTTCGASWKPCCAGNACNAGLACNASGTCIPSGGALAPDLAVIAVDIPSQMGVGITVSGTARITNVGNAPAQNSTASYYVDNSLAGSVNVPELQSGGVSVPVAITCPSVGQHIFKVSADSGNVVAESNEANNDMETAFNCV